jgi:hypothetical protein
VLIWLTVSLIWPSTPARISPMRSDRLCRRDTRLSAVDSIDCRAGTLAGLAATSSMPPKKSCSAGVRPTVGSASMLSTWLISVLKVSYSLNLVSAAST